MFEESDIYIYIYIYIEREREREMNRLKLISTDITDIHEQIEID